MTGSTTNRLIRYAGAGYIPWGSFWLWRVWKVRFSSWGQGDTFSWWWWLKFEMCCVMSRMWSGADDGKYVSGRGGGASHGLRPGRKPGGAWQAGVTWGGWWAGGGPVTTGDRGNKWPLARNTGGMGHGTAGPWWRGPPELTLRDIQSDRGTHAAVARPLSAERHQPWSSLACVPVSISFPDLPAPWPSVITPVISLETSQ